MSHENYQLSTMSAKPFIKFAGGKSRLLPQLMINVPNNFNNYHEPFVGGGALYWELASKGKLNNKIARLSDINYNLILTYQTIQENIKELILELKNLQYNEKTYYEIRQKFNQHDKINCSSFAAYFIYLNKTCFNGLYRENLNGEFNVPFGKYINPTICDEYNLKQCSNILNTVKTEIQYLSFENVLDYAKENDFIFLDPPYLPISDENNFTRYTKSKFGIKEHELLRDIALELKKRKCHVLISNSNSSVIKEIYKDHFTIQYCKAKRSINSNGGERGEIAELLIS